MGTGLLLVLLACGLKFGACRLKRARLAVLRAFDLNGWHLSAMLGESVQWQHLAERDVL
jgi:hypothetical protein